MKIFNLGDLYESKEFKVLTFNDRFYLHRQNGWWTITINDVVQNR